MNAGSGTYGPTTAVPINAPGTYRWVATYSGDANYSPVGPTLCGDPFETVTFAPPQPTISTVATPPAAFGGTSTDAATLTAPAGVTVPPSPAPTGTITFNLFGPNDPTCDPLGPIHSTSTVPVDHFGPPPYPSAASGPIVTPGTYHWVASYSGDANYLAAGPTACLDPAETFTVVAPACPSPPWPRPRPGRSLHRHGHPHRPSGGDRAPRPRSRRHHHLQPLRPQQPHL